MKTAITIKTTGPVKTKSVAYVDEFHLLGGLRAYFSPPDVFIGPCSSQVDQYLEYSGVQSKSAFLKLLRSKGLNIIGRERHTEEAFGISDVDWLLVELGVKEEIVNIWNGIAIASHTSKNGELTESARNIAFALRTSSLRLRDCSREYGWQNLNSIHMKRGEDALFSNKKSFDLDMALHSVLVEMATARDYLASFICQQILADKIFSGIDSMAKLFTKLSTIDHAKLAGMSGKSIADTILKICDRKSADGWMARLGKFRNIIVHESPLGSVAEKEHLTAKIVRIGEASLFQIYLGIPRDPILSMNSDYCDALTHFHEMLLKLRTFAREVAVASGIAPKIVTFTDADIIQPGTS